MPSTSLDDYDNYILQQHGFLPIVRNSYPIEELFNIKTLKSGAS